MPDKIDSNSTALHFAVEATPKVLPGSARWYELEPDSYEDFGAEVTTIARRPINVGRQQKKGVVTDIEADGGFTQDLVPQLARIFQGFMFADAREQFTTVTLEDAVTNDVTITAVTSSPDTYTAAADLDGFAVGDLVFASGFTNAANNGLKVVTVATGTVLTVTPATLVAEGSPPAAAKLETVGFVFDSGELSIDDDAAVITLTATSTDTSTLGLLPGMWIYLGGDLTDEKFVNNEGFAKIVAVTATTITIKELTWTPAIEAGGTLDIRMFFGTFIKNENTTALIVQRTYQLERQLGDDGGGVQSELLIGASCNELELNFTAADKSTVSLNFVGLDTERRTGATGIKTGTRIAAVVEDAFNTSSNVVRNRMYVPDTAVHTPSALFDFISELTLTVNNNVTGLKAIGTLGSFATNVGIFEVGGSITAYFQTLAAVTSIRNNDDVGYNTILAKDNVGMIFDVPLLSLGGGRVTVTQDEAITIPVESVGAKNTDDYTLSINIFPYLPNGAMP